jgi:hypothetical protein
MDYQEDEFDQAWSLAQFDLDRLRAENKFLREERDKARQDLEKMYRHDREYINILNGEIRSLEQEVYRLKRQRELALTHNPGQYGDHQCCPCVADIHKLYHKD